MTDELVLVRSYLQGSVLLPRGCVRDAAKKLPGLLLPCDYYSLLVVQAVMKALRKASGLSKGTSGEWGG